jgi:hypothetical protein
MNEINKPDVKSKIQSEKIITDNYVPVIQLLDIPDSDKTAILDLIKRREWEEARSAIKRIDGKIYRISSILIDIEDQAKKSVFPLPASDIEGNLDGYQFLLNYFPTNDIYKSKRDQYVAALREREKNSKVAAIARLKKKHDKIEEVTWYHHPNEPAYLNSRSTIYLYIGENAGGYKYLRMKIIYTSNDWLFVDKIEVWRDGKKDTMYQGRFDRDNNTSIWEWVDVAPNRDQLRILDSIGNAKEVIIRFHGMQYLKDVTMRSSDKQAIREILLAFESMKQ